MLMERCEIYHNYSIYQSLFPEQQIALFELMSSTGNLGYEFAFKHFYKCLISTKPLHEIKNVQLLSKRE